MSTSNREQSGFAPLNVEIESESEDEIDDSKEIQIEEALKLYQNALKLHSQGPEFYDEAENAYNELFQSEIFTWEESLSEARRAERYNDIEDSPNEFDDALVPAFTAPAAGVDGSPSSLPQILYLAYKNHGQFRLDRLKDRLSHIEREIRSDALADSSKSTSNAVTSSLKLFAEALDRDETDLELWRMVSRISGFLGSRRIARFCLEAVLDNDEDDFDTWTEPFGLEEGFAGEQLRPLLESLEDELSQSQVMRLFRKHKSIIASFRKQIDPCPYLPTPSPSEDGESIKPSIKARTISVPVRSWASCGKAILLQLAREAQRTIESDPGTSYSIVFPSSQSDTMPAPPMKTLSISDITASPHQPSVCDGQESLEDRSRPANTADDVAIARVLPEPLELSILDSNQRALEEAFESPTKINDADDSGTGRRVGIDEATAQADHAPPSAGAMSSVSLPTRKRSSETAELPESNDIGRSKSKRIKARGSMDPHSLKDSTAEDWTKWFEQQLKIYHQADDSAFDAVGVILLTLGSHYSTSLSTLRDILSNQDLNKGPDRASLGSLDLTAQDLRSTLDTWDVARSKAFLNGHDPKDPAGGIGGSRSPGFAAFVEHSNQDARRSSQLTPLSDEHSLTIFEGHIDRSWISLDELAYQWLDELLSFPLHTRLHYETPTLYEYYLWPDALKESVVQMLVFQDEAVYSEINRLIEDTEQQDQTKTKKRGHTLVTVDELRLRMTDVDEAKRKYTNLAQAIFELHLDVYGRITNPSSKVDSITRILQHDRLRRWAALASKLMNQWSWPGYESGRWSETSDNLYIRFLWATVVCNSLLESACRDNTISCYQDLIRVLKEFASKRSLPALVIELPNNAIMPEISVEAAEKEISRLTTMDFFMGVFNSDNTDPITIIESLEPLLDLSISHRKSASYTDQETETEEEKTSESTDISPTSQALDVTIEANPDTNLLEALQFLEQGSLPLRLFLWQKLRDAYRAIAYPPQVLSCDLRMVALIIDHLGSASHTGCALESRRDGLLRWLHRLDDHITRVLSIALSKDDAFLCIDGQHIRLALEGLTSLQKLLHVFALWEDTIRVGQTPPPAQVNQNATRGLAKSTDKFRDMIVKTWTLQYTLLKEAMEQNAGLFTSLDRDLINHLEHVHQVLGLRCYCSLANKTFLKLMKKELERIKLARDWEIDMAQLIYDLYGVKTSSNAIEMQDHGSLTEDLDRHTALEIMDLVMTQVNRISTKDLMKSDLKFTIDKMQQVIRIPKIANSASRTFNNRLVNNYLKSPLNPYDLYRSIRGIGGLCGSPVHDEGSDIAAKGWYSLLGHIALAKFRSSKRSSTGSTDDLDIARTFLRHDLEFDTNRWETWHRLAQVYDTLIEEDTTWTADKLDNHMDSLTELQRKAIHCYSMAIALATRSADASFEDTSKMADLCAEFGLRVYSSTREPFSMKAFSLDDYKRHYNSRAVGMYQDLPFRSMQLYSAWKLASILLRRASTQKPQNWVISYTFGKVLWKMHSCGDDVRGAASRIGYQPVIDAFVRAIEACPERRDNRHPEKDPILEPHYKLVSVVHKIVRSNQISAEEGCRLLRATPYARKASDLQNGGDWNGYVWQVLKALRSADKANWHHRMAARAAHILYDDEPNDPRAALGAKHELSQQIFTKTMAIQVWKPDNERAGRHFIYTGRYVRFFTRLLYQLNDKASLEALARRIRKRAGDFVNHVGIWEEVCHAYLKLLHHQQYCNVTDGYSEFMFQGLDPETFQLHAARLETWVHSQSTPPALLDILREALDLKKLNNNLFKPVTLIEDLIRDAYAHLYDNVIPSLIKNDAAEENRVRMRVDNILTNPIPPAVETPPPDAGGIQGSEQPKKSGARYVTPREIVRKAEAIVSKPAPTVPAKVLKPLAPAPQLEQDAKPLSDAARLAIVINIDGANDVVSSVPGSVHDSADDESELSEVGEEVVGEHPEHQEAGRARAPLFPNLLGTTADHLEEIDGDTNDERMEGGDEGNEQELDGDDNGEVQAEVPVKESGVHEGNW